MFLVDSHCHINLLDLEPFGGDIAGVLERAAESGVKHMLCVSVDPERFPEVLSLAVEHHQVSASAGVHPNSQLDEEPSEDELYAMAEHPAVVAVGETGLDYYRSHGDTEWQRKRFRRHIRVAKTLGKPLIIHSRDAMEDTLNILEEEGADRCGGVFHCFSEGLEAAERAMALNFLIGFSGVVTFKSATQLQQVARVIPCDRILVETDCPWLAPVPHRGKPNQPAYVRYVADKIAELRGTGLEQIAGTSSENFFRLFRGAEC